MQKLLILATTLLFAPFALAIDTQRPNVAQFIDTMVQQHDFRRGDLRSLLRNAQSKRAIIEMMMHPPEQVYPWFEYRDRLLTARRIDKGLSFCKQQSDALQRAEQTTGVSADTIVGILGVETMFGEITGNYRVLDSLATLAFDYPPRAEFFAGELEQFLLLTREEKIDARKVLGSYAGAIGAPQFMPSSYRKLAVDGDRNGRRDLWNSWPDIVTSVGNYLKSNGWRTGEPVVVSATLDSADLPKFDTSKIRLNETVASLREKGARFEIDLPPDTPAMLIVVEGRDGNEYRVGFHNFIAITRYNPRIKYALAVHDLGAAIARARDDAAR
ncbi:MAG TPA: lytic murein transglycosylase B [Steroidobacteraceae bacterium]|nr:lytic murein transglycosylase B [Steroidobacteraceae bacterium]